MSSVLGSSSSTLGERTALAVVFPSEARLTPEERTHWARLVKRGEAHRAGSATVILATGTLASLQRSLLTGLTMLAPPPQPSKVLGTIDDALPWLAPYLQATLRPRVAYGELCSALQAHVAAFRARH
jgi:hypothetical protein